jgi:hypothetical protein
VLKETNTPIPPTRVSSSSEGMMGNLHVEFNVVFHTTLLEDIKMKLKEVLGGNNEH